MRCHANTRDKTEVRLMIKAIRKWLEEGRAMKEERLERARKRKLMLQQQKRREEEKRRQKEREHAQYRQNIIDILQSGKIPDMEWNIEDFPFKLMKSEKLIWVFYPVDHYEHKTRRDYRGGSTGYSFRVAKGFWLRQSSSRGTPVEVDHKVHRGSGPLAVTTKHLYFSGDRTFRIRFSKIVSAVAFDDSTLVITRDRASGHPDSFVLGNLNWGGIAVNADFACDLIHAIEGSDVTYRSEKVAPSTYHLLAMGDSEDIVEFN